MAKSDKKSWVVNVIILAVIGLWAAAIGGYLGRSGALDKWLHPERETPGPGPGPAPGPGLSTPEVRDEQRWMGVYSGHTKIGYVFSRLRAEGENFQIWGKSKIRLKLLDQVQDIVIVIQGRLDPDYSIRELDAEIQASFGIKVHATRDGNNLVLVMDTAGEKVTHTIPFQQPPTLEYEWSLRDRLKTAKLGDRFSFEIFEPLSQSQMPLTVTVAGEEEIEAGGKKIACWKAELTIKDQLQWLWADKATGEIVKESFPATGLDFIAEDEAQALAVDWEEAGKVDILSALVVPSSTALPAPLTITYFKARLMNVSLEGLDAEVPGRQTVSGNTVEITMEAAVPAAGYALPITGSLPDRAGEFADDLAATPFMQSGHPKIKDQAERLAAGKDAVAAADALVSWVADNISDSLVVSVPSALEVLEQKRGACKEHTALFVALARAAGLPARPVAGIVYSDQMMLEGFYYHAWAEVYLAGPDGNGGWVAVDPTFNQVPADATHIRLIAGELDQMVNLIQVMGKLEVRVEDYR